MWAQRCIAAAAWGLAHLLLALPAAAQALGCRRAQDAKRDIQVPLSPCARGAAGKAANLGGWKSLGAAGKAENLSG